MSTTAFILGNGTSRKSIDLESLRGKGTIFGCNALYRDFTPDRLISVDKGITQEIQESGYPKEHIHITRHKELVPQSGSILNRKWLGISSGPFAARVAIDEGHTELYLIGMDFKGLDSQPGRRGVNNIYSDTKNYKIGSCKETYFGNWVNQLDDFVLEFDNVSFYHVNPLDGFTPQKLLEKDNFSVLQLDDFISKFNIKLL